MAKGKHSAALFEVFHGTKPVETRGKEALRTPRWWFKARDEATAAAAVDANDPTTAPIRSPLIAPRLAAIEAAEPEPIRPEPPKPVNSEPVKQQAVKFAATRTIAPTPARVDRDPADPTRVCAVVYATTDFLPRLSLDHDRREVLIRLRVTTAIVAAFVIVLSVALAYILGRRAGLAADIADADATSIQASGDPPSRPCSRAPLKCPATGPMPIPAASTKAEITRLSPDHAQANMTLARPLRWPTQRTACP